MEGFKLADQGNGGIIGRIYGEDDPELRVTLVDEGDIVFPGPMIETPDGLDHQDRREDPVGNPGLFPASKKPIRSIEGKPIKKNAGGSDKKGYTTGNGENADGIHQMTNELI
jgi:hypothetical protein